MDTDEIPPRPSRPLRHALLVCGAAAAVFIGSAAAFSGWAIIAGSDATAADPLLEAPPTVLAIGVVMWLAARRRPGPGRGLDLVAPPPRWWAYVPLLYTAYAAVWLGIGAVAARVLELPQVTFAVRWGEVGSGAVVRAVVLAVVLGPVFEEMVFRGVVQRALTERFGIRVALPAAAVLFAAIHLPDMGLQHLTAGVLYGWAHHRSGSLWVAVALHSLDNAVTIALRAALTGQV